MEDDNVVRQILEGARQFADQKRAEGWTQKDFARELSKFFDENNADPSGKRIIIDSLTFPLSKCPPNPPNPPYPPYININ